MPFDDVPLNDIIKASIKPNPLDPRRAGGYLTASLSTGDKGGIL
jgi:hypothetical protein